MRRIDGQTTLLQNSLLTKRIFVADPGLPPELVTKPKVELYAQTEHPISFPFSNMTDPEGNDVLFNINLGEAAKFARWDEKNLSLVVEARAADIGSYTIKLELIELIRAVKMPPNELKINLTVDWFEPPPPQPVIIPEPKNLPNPKISKFLMNGMMTILFNKELTFPEDLRSEMQI